MLVAQARQGDQAAMARLVDQYAAEVRMVARARLGAPLRPYVDSVDLVQSVHRSVLMGLRNDRFDVSNPGQLLALALTIVRRKTARHWRRVKRQQRLSGVGQRSGESPQLLALLSAPELDPARAAAAEDQAEQIYSKLEDTDRRLIQLRLEGYSTAEAARSMGLDPDVLRVRLSRLRKRLRESGLVTDWL